MTASTQSKNDLQFCGFVPHPHLAHIHMCLREFKLQWDDFQTPYLQNAPYLSPEK